MGDDDRADREMRVSAVVTGAARGIGDAIAARLAADGPMLRPIDNPAAGQEHLEAGVPLRRLGTADEVAAAIVFLASSDAPCSLASPSRWRAAVRRSERNCDG